MGESGKIHIAVFFLSLSVLKVPCFAAFDVLSTGGRSKAMGSAMVGAADGPGAIFINPAGLACQKKGLMLAFDFDHPFGLRDLRHGNAACAILTRYGGFGAGAQYLGNELYSESLVRLSWGWGISGQIYWGVNFNAAWLSIKQYGSVAKTYVDAGLQIPLSKRVTAGGFISNLNRARLHEDTDPLPQIIKTGFAYRPFPGMLFVMELEKDLRFPLILKGGAELILIPQISIRFGFTTNPSTVSCGLGLSSSGIHFDYAYSSHMILGDTHQMSAGLHLFPSQGKQ